MPTPALSFFPVPGLPLIEPGCDLAAVIIEHLDKAGLAPQDGDIVALAQKIVSKAEGCLVDLKDIEPSTEALQLAYSKEKDPRIAELILRESTRVVRDTPTVLIVEHRLGIVLANGLDMAGVEVDARPIQLVGDLSLQLFLGMSLISLPLLSLQGAFGVIGIMLLIQAVVITLFTVFLVFPLLGRNYDAACISAGFIGMGLGATPVGIANMDALTSRYGPSPKAYLVIPLLGAFFIDIANATLVQTLLGFELFSP